MVIIIIATAVTAIVIIIITVIPVAVVAIPLSIMGTLVTIFQPVMLVIMRGFAAPILDIGF